MRSRNGNRAFTLAICTLICTAFASTAADEYIISYRSVVDDATLIHESLNISRAMRGCQGRAGHSVWLDAQHSDNLHTIILNNFDHFFALIQREKLHVRHREKTVDSVNASRTVITLPPHCFTVDFNQGLVKISALN